MSEATKASDAVMLENVAVASKQFYSAGATFSTLACATVVVFAWGVLGQIYGPLKSHLCALALSLVIVLAYALVIPEPHGYPNAGKLRITLAEFLFGFINTLIVYSTAIALRSL